MQAAIELADADGLGAVSMNRIAERLGFTTMALYRHVRNKDDLLMLLADAAVGEPPPVLDSSDDGWRPGLERWSWELLAVMRRHPWVMEITITGPPIRPSQLAWLDRGLRALAGTALTESEKADVILLLNGCVFWEAKLSADLARAAQTGNVAAEDTPALDTLLSTLVDAERFPALRPALDAGIFEDGNDRDADFAFSLERVLDGVDHLVIQRAEARDE